MSVVNVTSGPTRAATGKRPKPTVGRRRWPHRVLAIVTLTGLLVAGNHALVLASPVQASAPVTPSSVCPTTAAAVAPDDGLVFDGVRLTAEQVAAATTIVSAGAEGQVSRRGTRIALAAALELSALDPAALKQERQGLFQVAALRQSDRAIAPVDDNGAAAARQFFADLARTVPDHNADARADWEIAAVATDGRVGRNAVQWFGVSQALNEKLNPQLRIGAGAIRATAPSAPEVRAGSAGLAAVGAWLPVTTPVLASPGPRSGALSAPALRGTRAAFAAADDVPTTAAEQTTEGSPASTTSAPSTTEQPSTTEPPATTVPPATTSSDSATETTGPEGSSSTSQPTTTPTTPVEESTSTTVSEPSTTSVPTTPTTATTTTESSPSTSTATPPTSSPIEVIPAPSTAVVPPGDEPQRPIEPPVVDAVVPVPDTTDDDPNVGPDAPPAVYTGSPAPIDCGPDPAGRSTSFDPGMIISDQVFYNSAAMTVDQVRAFIAAQGAGCEGEWCLRSLTVDVPEQPADRYCDTFAGGQGLDAAAVIVGLSVACGINPQVMLTTLQKESALLTRGGVTEGSYQAAFGWHCPDSGPGGSANCDPRYAGFVQQTAGMAKQWSRYRLDPDKYRYQAGTTATVLWNVVESGCGGSDVHIRNTATASLYNYTPYQPNAAALATYPGVGDGCSTYGNRNFFFLFQKWFGTTGGGASAEVVRNGVDVTIPAGPHVAAGAAGKVVRAPNAAVARGLAAGFGSIGLPYVWGGGTAGSPADQGCVRGGGSSNSCKGVVGFDCSGLTMYVLGVAGFRTPDHSAAQRSAGIQVSWDQALPGDLIGWPGHVAVYLGKIDGTPYLLEAPTVGMSVQVRPVYFTNGGLPVDAQMYRYWT